MSASSGLELVSQTVCVAVGQRNSSLLTSEIGKSASSCLKASCEDIPTRATGSWARLGQAAGKHCGLRRVPQPALAAAGQDEVGTTRNAPRTIQLALLCSRGPMAGSSPAMLQRAADVALRRCALLRLSPLHLWPSILPVPFVSCQTKARKLRKQILHKRQRTGLETRCTSSRRSSTNNDEQ